MFHDRSLLGRCFRGFVLPVLEDCSAVWCLSADTHFKLLDRAVSGARFLTGGVFECDIAHHRSVAVLCLLYKIRCKTMQPLNGARRVSRVGIMLFYWPRCSIPSIIFYSFSLLFFLSIGWYCGTGVFGLIGCISLSLSLALPNFFNNNNNINLL